MTFGTGRGRLYDAQKTARARYETARDTWGDDASRAFDEHTWQPLDLLVSDTLRASDQVGIVLTQARMDCEFEPGF